MIKCAMNKLDLRIRLYLSEQVTNFKYLLVDVNNKNNMHNKIQIKKNVGKLNILYHEINAQLQNVDENNKRKTLHLLLAVYACETLYYQRE